MAALASYNKKSITNKTSCTNNTRGFYHLVDINISETDAENILDKIEEFISEYHNRISVANITIIKDNELLKVLEPTYDDTKKAVEFITNNLDKLDND